MKEKVYIGDCEFVNDNGKDEIDIMLKSPMGVFAVCRFKGDGSNDVFYIHKDHLESWSIITDGDGVIIQINGIPSLAHSLRMSSGQMLACISPI